MRTGQIAPSAEFEKLYGKEIARERATPLSDDEAAALEPLNRHERRAALAKKRRAELTEKLAQKPRAES